MRAPEITALLEALMGKLEKDRAVVLVRPLLAAARFHSCLLWDVEVTLCIPIGGATHCGAGEQRVVPRPSAEVRLAQLEDRAESAALRTACAAACQPVAASLWMLPSLPTASLQICRIRSRSAGFAAVTTLCPTPACARPAAREQG